MNSMRDLARPKYLLGIGLSAIGLAIVVGYVVILGTGGPGDFYYLDLDVYRIGARAWAGGQDLYGSLPPTSFGFGLPFTYPPVAAVLAWPATQVSLPLAGTVLTLLGAISLILAIALVAGRQPRRWLVVAAVVPVALLLEPVRMTLLYGQVNLLLMALVSADCLVRTPRWPRGLLVGIAAAIKLTPAGFVLFFLLRKDYRAAATALGAFLGATAVGFVFAPQDSARYWSSTLFDTGRIGAVHYQSNQSLQAVLARFGIEPPARTALWLLGAAVVLVIAFVAIRRALSADRPEFALGLNALAILVISPVSWSHHWMWIVPLLLTCSIGWQIGGLAIFLIAPHWRLAGSADRELEWNLAEQLVGNLYLYFAIAVLLWSLTVTARIGAEGVPRLITPFAARSVIGPDQDGA
jgi:alpha-1,2-mannosyltransferase